MNTEPRRSYPGAAVLVWMALASLLSFSVAFALLFDWDYFTTPGFQTLPGDDDIAMAGMRVWNLEQLLLMLTVIAWVNILLMLAYRMVRKRRPAFGRAMLWSLLVTVVLMLCSPKWQEFQIRAYDGPGQVTRINFGYSLFPLFAYRATSDISTYYPDDDYFQQEDYLCVESREWKIASLVIDKSFYPILDDEHEHQLLQQRCRRLPDS